MGRFIFLGTVGLLGFASQLGAQEALRQARDTRRDTITNVILEIAPDGVSDNREFGGDPRLGIEVTLSIADSGEAVHARLSMTAQRGDTRAEGVREFIIYCAPRGFEIIEFLGIAELTVQGPTTVRGKQVHRLAGDGFVDEWEIVGDTNTWDVGLSRVRAYLGPIYVSLHRVHPPDQPH
jgi:hypothetical protein